MGMRQGPLTYTAFKVVKVPGPNFKEAVLSGLERGRFSGIDVALGHDRAVGFAVANDPLDTDFTEEKVFFSPLILFCFRQDRLAIPSTTFKLHVQRRVNQVLEETRRKRMPREEREDIEEEVRRELLRRALPAITAIEVVWDTESSTLRLMTASKALADEFVKRAREYLGLELLPLNIVGLIESSLEPEVVERVFRLLPSSFATIRHGG